jgi:hypothetical protein
VLAVRGSLTTDDVLTDVTGELISFEGGHVHEGMLAAAFYVHCNIAATLALAVERC